MIGAKAILKLGIPYAQLDRWTARGYLRADDPHPGHGGRRYWHPDELEVARRMAILVAAGVRPEAAHYAARNHGLLPGEEVRIEFAEDVAKAEHPCP